MTKYTYSPEARQKQLEAREFRRKELLDESMRLARESGYAFLTREAVAKACGVVAGTVAYVFGSIGGLKIEVMKRAVETGDVTIIRQGLVAGDPIALAAPDELKALARETLG